MPFGIVLWCFVITQPPCEPLTCDWVRKRVMSHDCKMARISQLEVELAHWKDWAPVVCGFVEILSNHKESDCRSPILRNLVCWTHLLWCTVYQHQLYHQFMVAWDFVGIFAGWSTWRSSPTRIGPWSRKLREAAVPSIWLRWSRSLQEKGHFD